MKKNYKIVLSVIILITTLISCKKWVDYNPKDDYKITDLEYLKSESDYRALGIAAYSPLQWLNQIVPIGVLPIMTGIL